MSRIRRRFYRLVDNRSYRKFFVIAVEGNITEPQYFTKLNEILNQENPVVKLHCIPSKHKSAPHYVLKRLNDYIRKTALQKEDEAWLVVDKDNWSDEQLVELYDWSKQQENYGLAVSNPNFEYWLLLHFEDGADVSNARECLRRLKQAMPDYNKRIDPRSISLMQIREAVRRARQRDYPPCADWPRTVGVTTVYKLVDRILSTVEPPA